MDRDVRPTFHLEAGYPLSKHRAQLTNESDRPAQRSEAGSRERWCTGGLLIPLFWRGLALFMSLLLSHCLHFYLCVKDRYWPVKGSRWQNGASCYVSSWQADWCGLWSGTLAVGTGAPYRCMCLLWAAVPGCVHTATGHRSHRPSALLAPGSAATMSVCWVSPLLMATLSGRASKWTYTCM